MKNELQNDHTVLVLAAIQMLAKVPRSTISKALEGSLVAIAVRSL